MRAVNQVAGPHGHKHRICHPVLSFCALFNPILSAMGRVADAAQPPPNGQLQLLCKIVARVVVLLPFQVCVQKGLLFHHPPRWLRWCLSFFFLFWASKRKLRSGVMTMTIDRDYDRTGGAQFDFFHRCLFLFEERVCFGRKNIQLLFETGIVILFLARWSVTGSYKMKYQSFWIIYYNLLNSLFLSSLSRMQQILLELYLKFLLE